MIGIILGIIFLIPIYLLIVSSFKPTSEVFDLRLIPETFSLDGYKLVFKQDFLKYFLNSLFISTTITIFALFFHSMAGYALARLNFAGKNMIFVWVLSTLMVPFAVIVVPLFILVKQFGWIDSYIGIIIPGIPNAYGIFLFRQFFLTLPKELEEAATLDGCSPFGIFTRIFLPLSKPIMTILAVITFIANWNNYLWPLLITQDQDKWVLQLALAKFIGRSETPWDAIMAGGVITTIPMLILFFILQKYIVEGIKMSGIK